MHRSLLVRFPGSAAKNRSGARERQDYPQRWSWCCLSKRTELWPEGYHDPAGLSFLGTQWAKDTPHWHAVAWALRKPWIADAKQGPTFNANIHGASYWKEYGAGDDNEDRFPTRFGRAEVSADKTEPLDVSRLVTDAAFGKTPEERLRKLEYCGFLVKKEEVYDMALFRGSYEWQTARGPQAILIETPKLVVTFAPGKAAKLAAKDLTLDFTDLAARLEKNKTGGAPTAVLPTPEQFEKLKVAPFLRAPGVDDPELAVAARAGTGGAAGRSPAARKRIFRRATTNT